MKKRKVENEKFHHQFGKNSIQGGKSGSRIAVSSDPHRILWIRDISPMYPGSENLWIVGSGIYRGSRGYGGDPRIPRYGDPLFPPWQDPYHRFRTPFPVISQLFLAPGPISGYDGRFRSGSLGGTTEFLGQILEAITQLLEQNLGDIPETLVKSLGEMLSRRYCKILEILREILTNEY